MILNPHKRGDTFLLEIVLEDDGSPFSIEIEHMKSQIRRRNSILVSDVSIYEGEEAGEYLLEVQDTTNWPLENLYLDIKIAHHNLIVSTDTMEIPVVKDVTRYE